MNLPSGEIGAQDISGSPKNSSRSSSGGWPVGFFAACCADAATTSATDASRIEQTTRQYRICNFIMAPREMCRRSSNLRRLHHQVAWRQLYGSLIESSAPLDNLRTSPANFHCSIAFRKMSSSESRL